MRTHRVASIPLDGTAIARDMERFRALRHSTAYSDYLCGGPWLSSLLWGPGDTINGLIESSDELAESDWSETGNELHAVRALIETQFHLEKLKYVRLAMMLPGSLIIPHRDLLELTNPLHRFHIPLCTDRGSLFAEGGSVFHMQQGELWALDAGAEHSVICNSTQPRIHLILDYREDAAAEETTRLPTHPESGIAADARVGRKPLPETRRQAMLALGEIISMANYRTLIELVTRDLYEFDVTIDYVWNTLIAIADCAGAPDVGDRLLELERYFRLERSSGKVI